MGSFSSKEIRKSFRVLSDLDDLELRIFDSRLHRRTIRAIEPFADGVEIGSFWKNKEILNLVQMYLDSSSKTVELFTSLKECLDRARNSHSILQSAINIFKKETPASYDKTLDQLKVFMAAGDPFSDEFFTQFEYVYKQQIDTLNKLVEEKSRLDTKLKSVKVWRKVSKILVIATFAAVMILTVIAAIVAPPMAGLAAALALPLAPIQGRISSVWDRIGKHVRGESGIIGTAGDHTSIVKLEIKNIRTIVNIIVINLDSLSKTAEFGVENQEEGLKAAIDEMKKTSKGLLRSIDELDKRVVRCRRYISWARKMILKKVEKHRDSDLS